MQLLSCFRGSQQCAEWMESPSRGLLIILAEECVGGDGGVVSGIERAVRLDRREGRRCHGSSGCADRKSGQDVNKTN